MPNRPGTYITLFDALIPLLERKTNIGVLVIDEDERASKNPLEADSHVNRAQEAVIEFAIKYKMPVWLIDSTRKELLHLLEQYQHVSNIHKGDANGFGDGYSWQTPKYADTGLHAQLQDNQITHLVVMGFHVNCCVEITVGVHEEIQTYGKGALHLGYEVLTSGDILRSSDTLPAGQERCRWKNISGVTYFESSSRSNNNNESTKRSELFPCHLL